MLASRGPLILGFLLLDVLPPSSGGCCGSGRDTYTPHYPTPPPPPTTPEDADAAPSDAGDDNASPAEAAVPAPAAGSARRLFLDPLDVVCVLDGAARCTEPRSSVAGAIGMVSGMMHTCVWTDAGDVYCAGYNKDGRVGNGKRSDVEPITQVAGLRRVVDMAAGARSSCAVDHDGNAWCWGDDVSLSPERVAGVADVVGVSSSQAETRCFLTRGGDVFFQAWGKKKLTQLPLHGVAALGGCWPLRVCVLAQDGSVACVDPSGSGKYATSAADLAAVRGAVGIADTMTMVSMLCVLGAARRATCWTATPTTPFGGARDVPVDGVAEIASGNADVCARKDDGSVACWDAKAFSPKPVALP
jgi:hypothetical protein